MRFSPCLIVTLLALSAPFAIGAQVLVWSDEFNTTTLDTSSWEVMLGTGTAYGLPAGWGNNEQQYYTNRPENLSVSGGYLHIVARRENYEGSSYTSARIRSANKRDFLYGRMEARIKLPSTKGIWPAFWMMPTNSPYGGWAACGEIDIVESVNTATTIYGTIHYGANWPNNQQSGGTRSPGFNYGNEFHNYAIEWEPDVIRWYVDNVQFYSVSSNVWFSANAQSNDRAPFDVLFHFLLNIAVGGNFPGGTDGTSVFPQEMLVDWVKVFVNEPPDPTQEPFAGLPLPIPGIVEAEDFDTGVEGIAYHDCDAANQGGAYRAAAAVDIEACNEGGFNLGWMCAAEWTEYTVDILEAGAYRVAARVASESTGGGFRLTLDGVDVTGTMVVPVTGGWQSWQTVTAVAELPAGEHILRFANGVASAPQYNVNRFEFTLLDKADIDRNGTVNLADYSLLGACFAGPDILVAPGGCTTTNFTRSDLDEDGDVDLADFGVFQIQP